MDKEVSTTFSPLFLGWKNRNKRFITFSDNLHHLNLHGITFHLKMWWWKSWNFMLNFSKNGKIYNAVSWNFFFEDSRLKSVYPVLMLKLIRWIKVPTSASFLQRPSFQSIVEVSLKLCMWPLKWRVRFQLLFNTLFLGSKNRNKRHECFSENLHHLIYMEKHFIKNVVIKVLIVYLDYFKKCRNSKRCFLKKVFFRRLSVKLSSSSATSKASQVDKSMHNC